MFTKQIVQIHRIHAMETFENFHGKIPNSIRRESYEVTPPSKDIRKRDKMLSYMHIKFTWKT